MMKLRKIVEAVLLLVIMMASPVILVLHECQKFEMTMVQNAGEVWAAVGVFVAIMSALTVILLEVGMFWLWCMLMWFWVSDRSERGE